MKKLFVFLLFCAISNFASATVIVDQIGDADGFGIGATHGSSFNFAAIGGGDGDGTDVWRSGDYSFTHTYSLAGLGSITSATLEIFTGGQGWQGLTSIFIDGSLIGTLTDGDDVGPGYNYAWLDIYDLTPFASLLNGADTITIDTVLSGDGWALDYSRLTISDEVPEPGTLVLMTLGLLSFRLNRRKRFQ